MPKAGVTALIQDEHEITRLVAKARAEGRPDAFFGKRQWTRYRLGLPLDISTDGPGGAEMLSAVMHNISGGGFGFWSKRELTQHTTIYVREAENPSSAEWLPARVTHCTVGLQGYLVGAAFESPCAADETYDPSPVDANNPDAPDEVASPREVFRGVSIAATSTFVAATAACGGVAAAGLAPALTPEAWLPWTPVAAVGVAGLMGALAGWLVSRRESRFLTNLRLAIIRMSEGGVKPPRSLSAPAGGLDPLRQSFLHLASGWRRREDDHRARRQKLEEITQVKSNILSIVSHDLRTPLTSILLYAQMLSEDAETISKEDQRRFLGIISEECTRLARLVDDLLEVQRLESGRVRWDLQRQDLAGTIRSCAQVFEAMANSKSIEFTVECPDSLPPADADADKISQVVSNLLSNAIKYTPTGGNVRLLVEARPQEIVIRVGDSGPGIPRDKWDQIFDRFSQLSDPNTSQIEGVGLGLYIVKRIVECHGGAAWVDSEVGSGSEFCVSLPTEATRLPHEAHGDARPSAGCVVVCDPDPELAATVAQMLRQEDFDVRVCHSGSRLLAQLAHGDVDVVVTDVLLPDMDADAVLSALETVPDRTFRLIVHSYSGSAAELSRRKVDIFLKRPASGADLVQAVASAMRKRAAAGRTVLLVGCTGVDTACLGDCLSGAGHTLVTADTLEDAAQVADVAVVSHGVLAGNWAALDQLVGPGGTRPRIIVLGDAARRRERSLAEKYGATLIAYRRGDESELAAALTIGAAGPVAETGP